MNLLVLLKNVMSWAFNFLMKAGDGIADAEERFHSNWLRKDENESNKK